MVLVMKKLMQEPQAYSVLVGQGKPMGMPGPCLPLGEAHCCLRKPNRPHLSPARWARQGAIFSNPACHHLLTSRGGLEDACPHHHSRIIPALQVRKQRHRNINQCYSVTQLVGQRLLSQAGKLGARVHPLHPAAPGALRISVRSCLSSQ